MEAELYAFVKASCEGLGLQNVLIELGGKANLEVCTDSSAAKGAAVKICTGRMKHVNLNKLWIQERASRHEILFRKIPREGNTADLMTHHWNAQEGARHLGGLHTEVVGECTHHGPHERDDWNESGLDHFSGDRNACAEMYRYRLPRSGESVVEGVRWSTCPYPHHAQHLACV